MTTAERTLKNGPYQIGPHTLPLFPPKGKLAPRIVIQLGNVPILPRSTVEQAIRDSFGSHMTVIEAVPFTIKHTPIMTSRWAMVVEPPSDNPDLDGVQVIQKILGKTVLASWPGSLPTCLSCLSQHGTKDCPKRQPDTPTPNLSYADAAGKHKQKKTVTPPQQSKSVEQKTVSLPQRSTSGVQKTISPVQQKSTPNPLPSSSSLPPKPDNGWKTVDL